MSKRKQIGYSIHISQDRHGYVQGSLTMAIDGSQNDIEYYHHNYGMLITYQANIITYNDEKQRYESSPHGFEPSKEDYGYIQLSRMGKNGRANPPDISTFYAQRIHMPTLFHECDVVPTMRKFANLLARLERTIKKYNLDAKYKCPMMQKIAALEQIKATCLESNCNILY